ncbi:MAG: SDR family oxidoreductase [Bacteroidetes bacterium]|nr:SDR family oxidoreductase [Bacteroidota bacterium]
MSTFFENKVVWITGASSGLGEALAKEFAVGKAKLVLSARRESELERVKKECAIHISPENILTLPMDVAELSNVKTDVQKVIQKFGRVDILLNNAGIAQRSFAGDTPIEVERTIMEVNYFGAIILTKEVLHVMRRQQSGNIVAISSVMGKFGYPGRSSYSASKHALHGYFESLRIEENKNNIHVHVICPGYVKTNVSYNAITETGKSHNQMDKGQEKGMDPNVAARKILNAIRTNRFETFFGGTELLALTLKRFLPIIFYRLVVRAGKK